MPDRDIEPEDDATAALLRGIDRDRSPDADDRARMWEQVLRRVDHDPVLEEAAPVGPVRVDRSRRLAVVSDGEPAQRRSPARWLSRSIASGLVAAACVGLVLVVTSPSDGDERTGAPPNDLVVVCESFAASTSFEGTGVFRLPSLITELAVPTDTLEAHLTTVAMSLDQLVAFLAGPSYAGSADARNAVDELTRTRVAIGDALVDLADGGTQAAINALRAASLSYLRAVASIGQLDGGGSCGG